MMSGSRQSVATTLAIVALSICFALVDLQARPVGRANIEPVKEHEVDITLDVSRRIDFIDIAGVRGSWEALYLGNHELLVDGVPFSKISMFRLLPTASGVRLLLLRTVSAKTFALKLDPMTSTDLSILAAQAANVGLSFTCRALGSCDVPALLPLVDAPIDLSLADGIAKPFLLSGWYPVEPWGRWSSSPDAEVGFRISRPHDVAFSASLQPLLSSSHAGEPVTVLANGCVVGSANFSSTSETGPKTITGSVPSACIGPDGRVELNFRVDRTFTPTAIGLGEDKRAIGIGLRSLKID